MIRSNRFKRIGMTLGGLLLGIIMQAQESANTSGGIAAGISGTASFSIGQIFYTTNTGSTGSISHGVQYAYEIIMVDTKESTMNIALTAYPNPTTDILTLQIAEFNNEKLSYILYDTKGKILRHEQITTNKTQINTSNLNPASYYINIVSPHNIIIHSFHIIKH